MAGVRRRMTQCTIAENTASKGGGAYVAELYNCAITKNTARGSSGGGVYNSILNDCVLEKIKLSSMEAVCMAAMWIAVTFGEIRPCAAAGSFRHN